MDSEKLTFFKQYCIVKGLEKRFAFGKITDGKPSLIFLNGETSEHIAYEGKYVKDGVFYSVTPATCGHGVGESDADGSCEVGTPNPWCIGKCYSKNKCAVYNTNEFSVDDYKYTCTLEDYRKIEELSNASKKQTYQFKIESFLSGSERELLRMSLTKLGDYFDDLERVSPLHVWERFMLEIGLAQLDTNLCFEMLTVTWIQDAEKLWFSTENKSKTMGEDFIYWYANSMQLNHVANPKDFTNIFGDIDYFSKIELSFTDAKYVIS